MPIRTRLTLSFTILFGIIVLGLAIGSYVLVRGSLLSGLDTQLHAAIDGTAMSSEHELNEHPIAPPGEADLQDILNERRDAALPDIQILVREGSRLVAYKAGSDMAVDLRTLPPDRLRPGSLKNLRIVYRDIPVPKFHLNYQIYAAASTDVIFGRLNRFALMLIVLVPMGLLLAAAAGFDLSKRALAPLNELSKKIDAVTSSDLSLRIKVAGSKDEISTIGAAFNRLLDRLQHAFDSQRRFMVDASHELRTPVTVTLAAAQVTTRDATRTPQDSDEALHIIEDQMLRLKNIVQQLLLLSQADASALKLNVRDLYLDDVLGEAVRAARVLAREKQIAIDFEAPPEAQVRGDPELLGQAVMVLLDNAVKFTPPGGRIAVGISRRGADWVCHVSDNGRGIPDSEQPHIFDRFYRAGQDVDGKGLEGSGLGLAIAKTIIDSHLGTLALTESRPGCTRFEIRLLASQQEEVGSASDINPAVLMSGYSLHPGER